MTSHRVEARRGRTLINAMSRPLFAFLATNFLAALILAQSQSVAGNQHNVCGLWGVIVPPGRFNTEGMRIELIGETETRRQSTRVVETAFAFQPALPGIYHLRVIDRSGKVIVWKTELLKGIDDYLILYVPYAAAEPSLKNIVSRAELNHKIPRQAWSLFRAALKAEEAGELKKSIEAFKKALTIDPWFVEAEIDLAVQFSQNGQPEEAVVHAQRAFDLRSGDPDAAHTLAMLFLRAKQYVQMERLARLMLANQRAVPEMHGLLALSLVGQLRNFDEAFAHLELAVENFPIARLLVADALIEADLPELAIAQVTNYLKSSTNACERGALESWVASVSQSRATIAAIP